MRPTTPARSPAAPSTGSAAPARAAVARVPAVLLATLLLAVAVLAAAGVLAPAPAAAVDSVSILSPLPDRVIEDPFTIVVRVDASDGEIIERVEAALSGPSNRSWQLVAEGPPDLNGVQRWSLEIDPLATGDVLRNGRHRLLVRPVPAAGDPPEFSGHDITLAVGVRGSLVAAPTGEDPTVVSLTWDPVSLPDFRAYRIERRPDVEGGQWAVVAQLASPASRDTKDQVPAPGAYRYRLVIVRGDGGDGEVEGRSEARGVRADPADPGTFEPPPEGQEGAQDGSSGQPDQGLGGDGGPVGRPGSVAQADPGPPQTGTAATPPLGSVQGGGAPPSLGSAPPRPDVPAVVPLNDGVFEPLLPLGELGGQVTITETESAFIDSDIRPGGNLAILTEEPPDRDVALAAAIGLLLIVVAGHLQRFLGDGNRG